MHSHQSKLGEVISFYEKQQKSNQIAMKLKCKDDKNVTTLKIQIHRPDNRYCIARRQGYTARLLKQVYYKLPPKNNFREMMVCQLKDHLDKL